MSQKLDFGEEDLNVGRLHRVTWSGDKAKREEREVGEKRKKQKQGRRLLKRENVARRAVRKKVKEKAAVQRELRSVKRNFTAERETSKETDEKTSAEQALKFGTHTSFGTGKYAIMIKKSMTAKSRAPTKKKLETASNWQSKQWQKKMQKRNWKGSWKDTEKNILFTSQKNGKILRKLKEHSVSNPQVMLLVLCSVVILLFLVGSASSCSTVANGTFNGILATSYTAEDEDILGTNEDYRKLEEELQKRIKGIENDYPGYDEYRYQLDEINHNPYELISYLTVLYEDFTRKEVQEVLQMLFEKQYELVLNEQSETKTKEVTNSWIDPESGESKSETVIEEYEYRILEVTLTNHTLEQVIQGMRLTADKQERYEILLETKGNKSYLFEDDIYANQSPGEDYRIPGEALTDQDFANMIREAEKYLGKPYVWGGSNPQTGFDCSGFVSWVINHSGNGWNVGRKTADGLRKSCTIVSAAQARPGDLIFFQGTYDTPGASHVGIYVGNGTMLHCGNPISYTSIETPYWQKHFYGFGKLKKE